MVLIGFEQDGLAVVTAIAEGWVVLPDFAGLESMLQNWQRIFRSADNPSLRQHGADAALGIADFFGSCANLGPEMAPPSKFTLDLDGIGLQKDSAHEGRLKR